MRKRTQIITEKEHRLSQFLISAVICILLSVIICESAFSADVVKRVSEEFYRYHEFQRSDSKGWLNAGETITTCDSVKVYEQDTGTETTSSMISDVAVDTDTTRCIYKLKAGTSGKEYYLKIKITSSTGQKFEDVITLEVF